MEIEVSNGEIIDKMIILSIKMLNIQDDIKIKNIKKEYEHLEKLLSVVGIKKDEKLYSELYKVNSKLWEIENNIREKERNKEFDNEFIELARSVYFTNDKRGDIKKRINEATNSNFVEEKSYKEY